MTQFTI